jgi:hypothetical protein
LANERTIQLMDRITDRLMKEQAWDQVGAAAPHDSRVHLKC